MGSREQKFILFIPSTVNNLFATFNQQNVQYFSLSIYIVTLHLIFLHISSHKVIALVWFPEDASLWAETCRSN